MLPEIDILEPVRARLAEMLHQPAKLRHRPNGSEQPDAVLTVGSRLFVVEAKSSNRLATIYQACAQAQRSAAKVGSKAIAMVAVPFMGPTGRQVCMEAGVSFADAAGNAHIEAPGLLIHIEGKPDKWPARGRPASVFAPRSSRIARLLLLDPHRAWQQKELAEQARIGRGFVSRIVSRLVNDELVVNDSQGKIRPSDPDRLLDAWKDEYRFSKHRVVAGHMPSRSGEELAERLSEAFQQRKVEYAFTGLPAAAKLAPFAGFRLVAAYLRTAPPEELLKALSFNREERGANTWLILPSDDGVFDGAKEIGKQRCVAAVQAYLDLLAMPERAIEAAQHLRERRLAWR